MKTYILDTIERFKRFSQSLDVKTILCSKAWYVLNEDGDTENLIFQEDGTILVSVNGSTKIYTWKFIPQNQSLNIMHSDTEGTMLKPAFMDGNILAFNKIGTKECMFLIDDSWSSQEKMSSLDSVKKYLADIEQKALREQEENRRRIEEEKEKLRREKLLQEETKKKNKIKELEFQLSQLESKRNEAINFYQTHEHEIKVNYLSKQWREEININFWLPFVIYSFLFTFGIIFLIYKFDSSSLDWSLGLLSLFLGFVLGFLLTGITCSIYEFFMIKKKYKMYIKKEIIKAPHFTYVYYSSLQEIVNRYNEFNLSNIEEQIQTVRQQISELK